jgi:hypothetical protein
MNSVASPRSAATSASDVLVSRSMVTWRWRSNSASRLAPMSTSLTGDR